MKNVGNALVQMLKHRQNVRDDERTCVADILLRTSGAFPYQITCKSKALRTAVKGHSPLSATCLQQGKYGFIFSDLNSHQKQMLFWL